MAKIAVVGTGISVLGSAFLLNPNHDVTVYEKAFRIQATRMIFRSLRGDREPKLQLALQEAYVCHRMRKAGARSQGALKDVMLLAGHKGLSTTERYIQGDSHTQRKLVALL